MSDRILNTPLTSRMHFFVHTMIKISVIRRLLTGKGLLVTVVWQIINLQSSLTKGFQKISHLYTQFWPEKLDKWETIFLKHEKVLVSLILYNKLEKMKYSSSPLALQQVKWTCKVIRSYKSFSKKLAKHN